MPKYISAALLAVLLLFCAVFLTGRSVPENDAVIGKGTESDTAVTEGPLETDEPEPPAAPEPKIKHIVIPEVVDEATRIRTELSKIMAINTDVVGWINVPGTVIDFPVVLGKDNDFYLDHSPEKYYYALGSIFEDYEDKPELMDNYNTVLYGHNVWYGGMFHDVEKFLEKDFFDETPVYYYTMENAYVFRSFSIFEASWEYQYFKIEFEDDEEFVDFCREMRDNSRFRKDIDFTGEDRILTLSTCTNGPKTQRWCYQAILTETVELPKWITALPFVHDYPRVDADVSFLPEAK